MVFSEKLHLIQAENARFGFGQRILIDIGGVEQCALFKALFTKENSKRVKFLAAAATRDPDLEGWIRPQMRYNFFPERSEIGGIAKHFADLNSQVGENARQHRRIVQKCFLKRRKRPETELIERLRGGGGHPYADVCGKPGQIPWQSDDLALQPLLDLCRDRAVDQECLTVEEIRANAASPL